jgi:diguanylate cyclase
VKQQRSFALANISSDEIQKIEKVIHEALSNHSRWYDDLIRRLLCRLPLPDSVMAKDSHRHCDFGAWFYGMGKQQVETLPAFVIIGGLHKIMHNSAREICHKVNATGYVLEADYDYFARSLTLFRQELHALKHKVSMLHKATASGQDA